MQKISVIFKILLWTMLFLGAMNQVNPVRASGPDDDLLEDNIYRNNYFSFQLPIPHEWHIADDQTIQNLRQSAENLTEEKSWEIDYFLLLVSEYPAGTLSDSNPSMSIAAENVSRFAGISNGQEYLLQLSKGLAKRTIYEIGEVYEYPLDGKPFYRLDLEVNTQLGTIRQSYIAMASKEYVLNFVLTGKTEEEMSRLENIITSGNYESMSTEVSGVRQKSSSSLQGILGLGLMLGAGVLMIIGQWLKRRNVNKQTEFENT